MLILYSSFISLLSVLCFIHFLYFWPETLDCALIQTKFLTLPPNPVFQNSLHRQFILIKYVVSRWQSGNRGRATSAREVIEVAGSNHAIGVTLKLAWWPSNSSPRNLHFTFAVFSLFFFPLSQFLSYLYSILFFLRNYLIGALCFFCFHIFTVLVLFSSFFSLFFPFFYKS